MIIPVSGVDCTGCRTCELACSFHFSRSFSRINSAIQIKRNESKGPIEILIHRKPVGQRKACDLCQNEKEPFCVKYCVRGVLKKSG